MKDNLNISAFELDELKEVVNIGASRASDVLSKMVDGKVTLTIPEAAILPVDQSIEYIGREDAEMAAVTVKIAGDAIGIMLFLFPGKSAHHVARIVAKDDKKPEDATGPITEEDKSALKEVGNILAGAYLSALAKFLKIKILHTVSKIDIGKLGAIINSTMSEMKKSSDVALIFKVSMAINDANTETKMYLLSDPKFTRQLLDTAKKVFGA